VFLANYTDGLTNLPFPDQFTQFQAQDAVASFISVKPQISYHVVTSDASGRVTAIEDISRTRIRINGGYFILKQEIFNYLGDGEELVREPFHRLLKDGKLTAYEYDNFWMAMDTFKDRQQLEEIYSTGSAPWEVWRGLGAAAALAGTPV
jgi:glucose-1-phosphate cytidylyltransferase